MVEKLYTVKHSGRSARHKNNADEKQARHVMDVNLMAPFKITQTFIPLLKKTQ